MKFSFFLGLICFGFLFETPASYSQESKTASLNIFCTAPAVYGNGREESEVAERVNAKLQYFANCYGRNITVKEAKEFKVRLRFVIKPAGFVDSVSVVNTTTKNLGFLECVKGIIHQMQFSKIPLSSGDSAVEQSIIFRVL